MKADWVIGRSAVRHAPDQWSSALGEGTPEEQERGLVALAGQYGEVAVRPVLPDTARPSLDLPILSKPMLPDDCRELFRLSCQTPGMDVGRVLTIVDHYGFTAHPYDWFPGVKDGDAYAHLETYLPWIHWAETSGLVPWEYPDITLESWRGMWPPARIARLRALHRIDPERTHGLISSFLNDHTPAEQKHLVSVVEPHLTERDQDFLLWLISDFPDPVRHQASAYLSRLGVSTATESQLVDLRNFFTVHHESSGNIFLKVPSGMETRDIIFRREKLANTTLVDLGRALNLDTGFIVEKWKKRTELFDSFLDMVALSGSSVDVDALVMRCLNVKRTPQEMGRPLVWDFTSSLLSRASTKTLRHVISKLTGATDNFHYFFDMSPGIARVIDVNFVAVSFHLRLGHNKYNLASQLAFVSTPKVAARLLRGTWFSDASDMMVAPLKLVVALGEASPSLAQE
jgi:hypothetical protein